MVDWIQVGSQYVGLRDQINDKFSSTCSTRTYDENSLHLPLMCLSCCKRELQYKEVDQRSTIFSRLSVSGKSDCHAFSTKLYTQKWCSWLSHLNLKDLWSVKEKKSYLTHPFIVVLFSRSQRVRDAGEGSKNAITRKVQLEAKSSYTRVGNGRTLFFAPCAERQHRQTHVILHYLTQQTYLDFSVFN